MFKWKERMSILVACDGSSLKKPNGEMRGAIGWAWAREDGHWQSHGWFEGTNQIAELHGIRSVLLFHKNVDITIQMDSQYALNVTEKWAKGWARKNWVKSDGKPVLNKPIIAEILQLMEERTAPVKFQWVKGHRKDNKYPLNTEADKRAGDASALAKINAKDMASSLLLYKDSKNRTSMPQEELMLRRIYSQDFPE